MTTVISSEALKNQEWRNRNSKADESKSQNISIYINIYQRLTNKQNMHSMKERLKDLN